jgi:hypothetical protein
LSADRSEAAIKKWSQKESFPWPQVLPKNNSKDYGFMKYRSRYVPQYLLVDKDGNKVVEGLAAAMKKIETL